ncbi:hypothetical protein HMPREF9440_01828 [Sutterella parvirubra YIT 11816]|uniref:Uncharacterized protein n=1 Tax=Sutterella parvirubra YIT 11816 TaxID=762967 RepID=H3KGE8_9BURK|nr:hypothetical protein HMPREF9440_01828 [Sutterella parvirubra YIT 11816]
MIRRNRGGTHAESLRDAKRSPLLIRMGESLAGAGWRGRKTYAGTSVGTASETGHRGVGKSFNPVGAPRKGPAAGGSCSHEDESGPQKTQTLDFQEEPRMRVRHGSDGFSHKTPGLPIF